MEITTLEANAPLLLCIQPRFWDGDGEKRLAFAVFHVGNGGSDWRTL